MCICYRNQLTITRLFISISSQPIGPTYQFTLAWRSIILSVCLIAWFSVCHGLVCFLDQNNWFCPVFFFFLMLLKYTHRPDLQKMKCCLFYSHIIIQANYWFASFFTFILSHNCWVSKLKAFQWTSSALWGVNKKISNSEFHRRERKDEMRSLHSHQ